MSGKPRRIAARCGRRELELGSELEARVAAAARQSYLVRRAELAPLPPAAERSSLSEERWQRQVVELARTLGWYVYHPKLSKWSERGWPDLSCLHLRHGRALWLECKSDSGQLTEAQVLVLELMRAAGLAVHVVRPHDTLELVAELLA